MGNPQKAAMGYHGQTFYFCRACGRLLTQEERAADNKKIALKRKEAAADAEAPSPEA
jgi:hypothetical protein